MIPQLVAKLRAWRHALSRSEWVVRLLGLPRTTAAPTARGLVLIQIDGLARAQMERAIDRRRLPFLRALIRHEEYRLWSFYAGLPATTPAVQAELLYGVPCAVPSFQFRDPDTGRIVAMYDQPTAAAIEGLLSTEGEGLLLEGTAYSDVYSGGADIANFCAATTGLAELFRKAHPLRAVPVLLLHSFAVVRMLALAVLEIGIAVWDVLHGAVKRRNILRELRFIPSRIFISILLREIIVMGAKADAARGVPIIHCNFLGYDEHAHRRGPSSAFAHWSLRGIDRSVRSIWRSARRSPRRDYDVWIYSDHGQEDMDIYQELHGRSVREAVSEVLSRHGVTGRPSLAPAGSVQLQRTRMLGGKWLQRLSAQNHVPVQSPFEIADMGPVGHIYLPQRPTAGEMERIGPALVNEAQIPTVTMACEDGSALAWTADGRYSLPDQAGDLLGHDHPFLPEVTRDLLRLIHHRAAGQIVIFGFRRGGRSVTFANENGSHAGPGPEECHGFALLPPDAPVQVRDDRYMRPTDLREGAQCHLGRRAAAARTADRRPLPAGSLRVMSYNIHGCVGTDGKHSPERIARAIGMFAPDVVTLQEVDYGRPRSDRVHHAQAIADLLEMQFHFHPSLLLGEGQYGNAVLSRLPMRPVKSGPLPGQPGNEPRGAVWVEIDCDGEHVQILTTHLGLRMREQALQVRALLGREWLGNDDMRGPVILCGDFNTPPGWRTYRSLRTALRDAHREGLGPVRRSWMRLWRLDFVFVSDAVHVLDAHVPRNDVVRLASDHLPVVADLCVTPGDCSPRAEPKRRPRGSWGAR